MEFKEIQAELEVLKSTLETSIAEKTKADIQPELNDLKGKVEELITKAAASKTAEEVDALKNDMLSLKADNAALTAGLELISKGKHSRVTDYKPDTQEKSFQQLFSEGVQEKADEIRSLKKGDRLAFDLKAVGDMTFPVNFPTAAASVAYVRPGIIELPRRKLHIRQLFNIGGMDNKSTYNYVKEVAGEGAIAPVAEGALKPQIDLDLVEASVKAEWIAGWLRISRNMLDDVTGMTTFLNNRLPEKLLRVEDDQLLNGNGTSPNLSGITDTGNFTAPNSGYTIDVEQLVGAIAQLEGYDREANGILLHPADYYRLWLNKAAGSGEYDQPGLVTIVNGQMFIGGVPVFKSTAMAQDKFIVGDWRMGADLIQREAPRVEFFYEDGINVRENKVTVRVEERLALAIYGSDYFIYGDFSLS